MIIIHCYNCKKFFIYIISELNIIICKYCYSDFIEILKHINVLKPAYNEIITGEIINILKQEYNNIMSIWNKETNKYNTSDDIIWNNILKYILESNGQVINNINIIIKNIDPIYNILNIYNNSFKILDFKKLIFENNRYIFIFAILDLLHQEMKIPIGPLPASKKFIKNINKFKLKSNIIKKMSNIICPICFEIFKKGIICIKLQCNHIYHSTCIKKWFKNNNTCPKCRYKVLTDNKDYNIYHIISKQISLPKNFKNNK